MNKLIICDTREKGNKKIIKYFEQINQDYIISKLDAGDYMYYKDYSVIIDKKDGLLELAGNLCHSSEHERIKREIEKAKKLGCKKFIFLIQDDKINSLEDIKNWSSQHTKIKGETLLKIMLTMRKKYDIHFMFCKKSEIGQTIIMLLNNK